ncbi:MAG: hypothetical protein H0W88_08025 [Parachlamydiaceae bacterium]|nr:hypothetical protein [Parachlamydiaceae bacterium]
MSADIYGHSSIDQIKDTLSNWGSHANKDASWNGYKVTYEKRNAYGGGKELALSISSKTSIIGFFKECLYNLGFLSRNQEAAFEQDHRDVENALYSLGRHTAKFLGNGNYISSKAAEEHDVTKKKDNGSIGVRTPHLRKDVNSEFLGNIGNILRRLESDPNFKAAFVKGLETREGE